MFTREDFKKAGIQTLKAPKFGNAHVFKIQIDGQAWVVKDFRPCPWFVRATYGRMMIRREVSMLRHLADLPGTPDGTFRIDGHAFAMRFIEGTTLRDSDRDMSPAFFELAEARLKAVHARCVVHLDLRNSRNIMVDKAGAPVLVDFQSGFSTRWLPRGVRRFLENVDLSGIYKHWASHNPDSMGEKREKHLLKHLARRNYWPIKGYKIGLHVRKPKHYEQRLIEKRRQREASESRG